MNRKTAIAAATALSATAIAGALAIGANLGILGFRSSDRVGSLSPVAATRASESVEASPSVVTVYVDPTSSPAAGSQGTSTPGSSDNVLTETVVVKDPPRTIAPTTSTGEHESSSDSSSETNDD